MRHIIGKIRWHPGVAWLPLLAMFVTLASCGEPAADNASAAPAEKPIASKTQAPMSAEKEVAKLLDLENRQMAIKKSFEAGKKDAKVSAEYLKATLELAKETMTSLALSSKEKYPKALRLYREVLEEDPDNPEALKWKNEIETIYKSMGRPIPK